MSNVLLNCVPGSCYKFWVWVQKCSFLLRWICNWQDIHSLSFDISSARQEWPCLTVHLPLCQCLSEWGVVMSVDHTLNGNREWAGMLYIYVQGHKLRWTVHTVCAAFERATGHLYSWWIELYTWMQSEGVFVLKFKQLLLLMPWDTNSNRRMENTSLRWPSSRDKTKKRRGEERNREEYEVLWSSWSGQTQSVEMSKERNLVSNNRVRVASSVLSLSQE